MVRGQTLFELVIALAVSILIIAGLVIAVTYSIKNATFSKNKAEATRLAQEAIEWVRAERNASWETFTTRVAATPIGSSAPYCMNNTPLSWTNELCTTYSISGTSGKFKRDAILTRTNTNTIEVEIVVSWQDGTTIHRSKISTRLTNWTQ